METNKLATHAMCEPILAVFIIKKIFPFIDQYTLRETLNRLNDEDFDELLAILKGMNFNETQIEKLLK